MSGKKLVTGYWAGDLNSQCSYNWPRGQHLSGHGTAKKKACVRGVHHWKIECLKGFKSSKAHSSEIKLESKKDHVAIKMLEKIFGTRKRCEPKRGLVGVVKKPKCSGRKAARITYPSALLSRHCGHNTLGREG